MPDRTVPRGPPAPPGGTVVIDEALIQRAVAPSRESPRGRIILPLHQSGADICQRMLHAVQPGSSVRPHRHRDPPNAETVVVLRGSVRGDAVGLDVRPGVYHTFAALEPDTVVFEAKTGPYEGRVDKDFAPWAPVEGSPEAGRHLATL